MIVTRAPCTRHWANPITTKLLHNEGNEQKEYSFKLQTTHAIAKRTVREQDGEEENA